MSQCFLETKIVGEDAKLVLSILHDQRANFLHLKYGYIDNDFIEIGRTNNLHHNHSTKFIK